VGRFIVGIIAFPLFTIAHAFTFGKRPEHPI